MTKTKSTKRALLMSALSLLMCVSMLIGSTFAWFTDTASTAVNKIQSGKLDVVLEMSTDGTNWESAEGKTLTFKTKDNRAADQILWEPGCTYELPQLRVVNKGNLALKYKIQITGIQGDAKLNEVIDWTINDADINLTEGHLTAGQQGAAFTIKGHMQETAGNKYQGLTIDGIGITVVATQDTVENDSVDNQYDKDATYLNTDADGNYLISNANELVYFAKSVNVDGETYADKTVKLTADIDLAGKLWIPVGQTRVSSFQGTFDGQGHTIKNMTVNYTGTNSNYACGLFGWIELHNGAPIVIQNVKFDNANVTGIKYTGVVAGYANGASGAEIKNCVVTNSTVTSNSKNAGGIIGYMGKGVLTGNTVYGCTISAKYDVGGIANSVEPAVTFTKNKVENTNIYYAEDQAYDAAGIFVCGKVSSVTIDSTNTNSNVTVNKLVAVSTAEELSAALKKTYTEDTTVMLTKDITLTGEWGEHSLDGRNNANLTINGNGNTIYGLTSTNHYSGNGFNSNGLVTYIKSGFSSVTFKNLTIDGATLTNNGGDSAATGVFVGDINTVNVTFDTCTVKGANVNCYKWAGGFIGYIQDVYGNKSIKLINCVVSDSNINTTDSSVGGLVGQHYTNLTITGCKIMGNTTIKCDENRNGKEAKAGYLLGTATVKTTTISNITVESTVTLNTMGGTTYDTTNYVGRIDGGATVNGVTPNS